MGGEERVPYSDRRSIRRENREDLKTSLSGDLTFCLQEALAPRRSLLAQNFYVATINVRQAIKAYRTGRLPPLSLSLPPLESVRAPRCLVLLTRLIES